MLPAGRAAPGPHRVPVRPETPPTTPLKLRVQVNSVGAATTRFLTEGSHDTHRLPATRDDQGVCGPAVLTTHGRDPRGSRAPGRQERSDREGAETPAPSAADGVISVPCRTARRDPKYTRRPAETPPGGGPREPPWDTRSSAAVASGSLPGKPRADRERGHGTGSARARTAFGSTVPGGSPPPPPGKRP